MPGRSCSAAPAPETGRRIAARCSAGSGNCPREQWAVLIPDHHPGYITWDSLRGQHREAAGELAARRAGRAAAPRGKAPRCCRACCAAASAAGSCKPAIPGRKAQQPRATCAPAPSSCTPTERGCQHRRRAGWRRPSWPSCSRCWSPPRWQPPPRPWPRPTTSYRQRTGRLRAGRRACPLRRRPRLPPVRRGRAGEPAGRPHPGTRAGKTSSPPLPARRERPGAPSRPAARSP